MSTLLCRLNLHAWLPTGGAGTTGPVQHACRRCGTTVKKKSILDTAFGRAGLWGGGSG